MHDHDPFLHWREREEVKATVDHKLQEEAGL